MLSVQHYLLFNFADNSTGQFQTNTHTFFSALDELLTFSRRHPSSSQISLKPKMREFTLLIVNKLNICLLAFFFRVTRDDDAHVRGNHHRALKETKLNIISRLNDSVDLTPSELIYKVFSVQAHSRLSWAFMRERVSDDDEMSDEAEEFSHHHMTSVR